MARVCREVCQCCTLCDTWADEPVKCVHCGELCQCVGCIAEQSEKVEP